MESLEQEATDAGISRGWDHANYVDSYGGTMTPEESEIEIPLQFMQVPTYYTAGYLQGVEEFESDHLEDDEFVDPREPEWQGLV